MDGSEQIYNKNRVLKNGKGAFSSLQLNNFLDYNGSGTINMVLSEDNYSEFYDSFKFVIDKGFTQIKSASDMYKKWSEEELGVIKKNFIKCAST